MGKPSSTDSPVRMDCAATVTGLGDPFQVPIFKTTANYFDVLGLRAIRGRTFLPEEEEGADVAVITDRFWKARLGGDPNVIGRALTLDGVAHTIVGVIPKLPVSWTGPNADIWTTKPFIIPGFSHERMMRGTAFLRAVGRLKPGVTIEQARAALQLLENSYRAQYPEKIDAKSGTVVKTLPEDVTENLRPGFATLLAAVTFVLLIACSNVANLLLVRFSGRRREISLRMALGAIARERAAAFCFRKRAHQFARGNSRRAPRLAIGPARAETRGELPPDRSRQRDGAFISGARVHDRALAAHRSGHGLVSRAAKLARGYRRCAEGRRPRNRRQRRGNNVSANCSSARRSRSRSPWSRARRCSSPVSCGSVIRIPVSSPTISGSAFTVMPQAQYPDAASRDAFRRAIDERIARHAGCAGCDDQRRFSALSAAAARRSTRAPKATFRQWRNAKARPPMTSVPGWLRTLGIPLLAGRDFNEQDIADHPNVDPHQRIRSEDSFRQRKSDRQNIARHERQRAGRDRRRGRRCAFRARLDQHNDMEFYRPFAQENFPFLTITVRSPLPPESVTKSVQAALEARSIPVSR